MAEWTKENKRAIQLCRLANQGKSERVECENGSFEWKTIIKMGSNLIMEKGSKYSVGTHKN